MPSLYEKYYFEWQCSLDWLKWTIHFYTFYLIVLLHGQMLGLYFPTILTWIITLPADGLAPNGARPSAGSVMTVKLNNFFCSYFGWQWSNDQIQFYWSDYIIQNAGRDLVRFHGTLGVKMESIHFHKFLSNHLIACLYLILEVSFHCRGVIQGAMVLISSANQPFL